MDKTFLDMPLALSSALKPLGYELYDSGVGISIFPLIDSKENYLNAFGVIIVPQGTSGNTPRDVQLPTPISDFIAKAENLG